jgi:hypothetical protein
MWRAVVMIRGGCTDDESGKGGKCNEGDDA